jgi:hypothetical protein
MTKLTLANVQNLQNESAAITTMAQNNVATAAAMENTLSLDGTQPNQMKANLDMNSNRILNLPDAINAQEPATYSQLTDKINALDQGAVIQGSYVTVNPETTLANERVLTGSTNIGITDTGPDGEVIVSTIDPELNALSQVTSAADKVPYFTGLGTADVTTLTPFARTLIDDPDQATAQATLGVSVGTSVQPHDTDLDALAAISTTGLYTVTGSGTSVTRTLTGTANEITATNGSGVSGNPTVSLPTALTFTGKTVTGGTYSSPNISAIINTGTVTLPTSTDTLMGKATTDVMTNKTFDTAGAGNVFKINGTQITANTGTGSNVLATSPTLTTPVLGVASATTINKVTLTTPATGSTLTVADGKTLTASNTLTFTGTDGSSVALGTGGTNSYVTGSPSANNFATFSNANTVQGLSLTGLVKGNGASAPTAAASGTDYLAPPSGTAILKANSGGALANATANTDYLTPPSGTAILKANSGGALANTTAGTDYMAPTVTSTITKGFLITPNNIGTISSGTVTPDATQGNYQFYTNNGAHTLAAPANDSALDILITNGASAGSITLSGFTVGASVGDSLTTTNTNKFIISIRRINSISTYIIKALQ